MMRRLLFPALSIALFAACNRAPTSQPETTNREALPTYQSATPALENAQAGAASAPAPAVETPTQSGSEAPLNDAQIARITSDANAAEISQGKLAEVRAKDGSVKAFAVRMVKHHGRAKEKQEKLGIEPASSDAAVRLEHDGENTLSALTANSDASFDTEYMAAQVKEHQSVLDTIDQKLLPNVKSDALKAYLNEIRPTVASHLKDARALLAKLSEIHPAQP